MKLIDADALKNELKYGWVNDKFVLRKIDEASTIDAVPVVRCKDCRYEQHCDWLDEKNGKECYVCVKQNFVGLRSPDWYCADGERMDGKE